MKSKADDDWMKPDPPDPWRALGRRFLGCALAIPIAWIGALAVPMSLLRALLFTLPFLLWTLSLVSFCRDRFWRDPRPLWGRLDIAGRDGDALARRVAATLSTLVFGWLALVPVFLMVAIPFAAGRAPI